MSTTSSPSPPRSHAGRFFLAFLGLSLAVVGAVFVWLMARSFERAREMRAWPEVPCVIISSEINERRVDPNGRTEYRLDVVFGYEWKGKNYTSDHITLRGNPWSAHEDVMKERAEQYPLNQQTTCRVNPRNPGQAVLKPDSLAPGYSIWFPGIILIGGLVMTGKAWAGSRRAE